MFNFREEPVDIPFFLAMYTGIFVHDMLSFPVDFIYVCVVTGSFHTHVVYRMVNKNEYFGFMFEFCKNKEKE